MFLLNFTINTIEEYGPVLWNKSFIVVDYLD